ncbi:P-loop containing nucleoside triphosphate hydrolase protein [Rhizoctonia solani]|uniref:P-loop containing nucleoside triphosphate hydrolase protein n=1 Tax=Rhizoctonia solani TaxID=456999 RepID=A0A8H7M7W6_9AGAM|nr:P-loop containing nucleoside triphosphate hydrolase protein [Rhizoctonia solani]
MDQVLLWETVLMVSQPTPIWKHNLLIPIACAVLSIVLLLLHGFLSAISAKYLIAKLCGRETEGRTISVDSAPQQLVVQQHTGFFPDLYSRIRSHGGTVVFVWKVLRLMACLTLTGLTTGAIVLINEGHNTIGTKQYKPVDDPHLNSDMDILKKAQGSEHQKYTKRERWFSTAEWIEISLCMFYTYTTLLAILALTLAPRSRAAVNTHLVVLLLIAFAVYIWRDLVPFATYDLDPVDAVGGWLTWARIGVLGFASVVVPLFIPRIYVPIDPNNPSKNPNPEQTASLISLLLYSFLDPLLWTAYRAPKLEYEQLPPLADYDRASHLKERSFSKLDPLKQTKPRYFFWGLMAVFWKEYVVMAITLIIKAMMDFAGPIGIKYILRYLETPSDPGYLRPWFWILWLLIGPIFGSIAWQWYIFLKMNSVVRATGMITQLIFEHTLRIRMNAQAADEPSGKTSEPEILTAGLTVDEEDPIVTTGSDSGEPDGTNNVMDASNTQTLIGSTSSAKVRIKEGTEGEIENKGNDSLNLIGRINNLIAIIGMCFMVLSFPIPGKLAQLVNDVEKKQMKKTDERVQIISETLNVIRMVKLFGWEKKVVAKVAEKRVVELEYYKRKQWIGQVGANTNFILPLLVMALTFASHTLWFKQELTASIVFSSIGVFDVLRSQLHMLAWQIPAAVQAKVSIDRIDEFLHQVPRLYLVPPPPDAIGFRNATFAWSRQAPATPTPSRRNFRLHIDQELLFHRGKINMVVGPTGSGKTSLLMALLGEMHFVPSAQTRGSLCRDKEASHMLPRKPGSKTSPYETTFCLEPSTTKSDTRRCALERDLTLFDAGDQTEGHDAERRSEGSSVACACDLLEGDIIILDDVLSALDVHTSRWVVDHCFRGELVAGRTMIIVTHNVAMVSEVAHFVVSLGSDGGDCQQGSIDEALRLNPKLKAEAEKDEELERKGEEVVDESNAVDKSEANAKKGDGKLMVAEEVAEGISDGLP